MQEALVGRWDSYSEHDNSREKCASRQFCDSYVASKFRESRLGDWRHVRAEPGGPFARQEPFCPFRSPSGDAQFARFAIVLERQWRANLRREAGRRRLNLWAADGGEEIGRN